MNADTAILQRSDTETHDGRPSHQKRFLALDALRGAAALAVVVFHDSSSFAFPLAPYAYLAVDLFFCLSGYVLAHAYSDRFNTENVLIWFMKERLIRLMPMIWLGVSLCALSYMIYGGSKTTAIVGFFFGILNLPMLKPPTTFHQFYVFPINPSQYSLFLEIVVNLFWVTFRKYTVILAMAAVISAAAFIIFGGGGGAQPDDFWSGFPRAGISFLIGIFLYRFEAPAFSKIPSKVVASAFWLLFIVAVFVLYVLRDKLYNDAIICGWTFGLSPLLVAIGGRVVLPPAIEKAAAIAGKLSYPIYALHLGTILLVEKCLSVLSGLGMPGLGDIGTLCVVIPITIAGSWLAYVYIDVPVRAWLSRRLKPPAAPDSVDTSSAARVETQSASPPS